jgi:hypothetical protein
MQPTFQNFVTALICLGSIHIIAECIYGSSFLRRKRVRKRRKRQKKKIPNHYEKDGGSTTTSPKKPDQSKGRTRHEY